MVMSFISFLAKGGGGGAGMGLMVCVCFVDDCGLTCVWDRGCGEYCESGRGADGGGEGGEGEEGVVEGLCGGFGGGGEWRGEGREGGVVVWVGWLVGVEGRKGMVGGKSRGGLLDGLLVSRSFSMIYSWLIPKTIDRVGGLDFGVWERGFFVATNRLLRGALGIPILCLSLHFHKKHLYQLPLHPSSHAPLSRPSLRSPLAIFRNGLTSRENEVTEHWVFILIRTSD